MTATNKQPFRVVIAGAGVAGLEAALALKDLAGERVVLEIVSPNADFVYRPMTVVEPFAYGPAKRYEVAPIAVDLGAQLIAERFVAVDPDARIARTNEGTELPYDALLLALGAQAQPPFSHVTTIDDRHMDDLLHGVIQDVEGGYVKRLAFVIPARIAWPFPIYELALMTAARAYDTSITIDITIVTSEDRPLAIFRGPASEAVARLLHDAQISTITSAYAQVPDSTHLTISPGNRQLEADRIIALPELNGPAVSGLHAAEHGFIPVDPHGRVRGVEHVFAAGDATDFPVKHGGLAAQQALAAAQSIAALAGAALVPEPFQPIIRGKLLTGGKPCYITANMTGGHGFTSTVSDKPRWETGAKIAAPYLAPYLEQRDHALASQR
jgi:sulfide:quinone oxidoreductase